MIFMSSRFHALLAAVTIWAAACPTSVLAQDFGFAPPPDLGYAQRHRLARRQNGRAVRPAAFDAGPTGNSPTPAGSGAPAPMADANFSDNSLGPGSVDSAPGSYSDYDSSGGGGDYVLPRFDNGWCNSVGSCCGGCKACSYSLGQGDGGYGCGPNGCGPNGCSGGGCGGGDCGGDNCGCGNFGGWGPRGPIYVRGEYLGWWLRGDNVPALVTTSPTGTVLTQAGVLGQSGTNVLFGNSAINNGMRSGARVTVGWWLDPTARIEAEFFGLGNSDASFNQSSGGSPILARPFYNLQTGAQDANVLAFPGRSSGSISVQEQSSFLGGSILGMRNLSCVSCCPDRQSRWDFLYGFRYLRLAENLTINSSLTSINTAAPTGTVVTSFDGFKTANNFYGADFGLMSEQRSARWSLTTTGRFALGFTSQGTTISGNSTSTPPGGPTTSSTGGLLALPTNIGTYHRDVFTYVPQLQLKLGYYITQNLRLTAGYDLIYWSRVARPGEQISTSVNTSQASGGTLTGPAGPLFSFHESGLLIQGFSVGGELWF
jgi:Putative beta barrel porin-7 (BBP7)